MLLEDTNSLGVASLELAKVASIFGLMILFVRFKINLGIGMLAASGLLAILYRVGLSETLSVFLSGATASSTLLLIATIYMIMFLEKVLTDRALMNRMVSALKVLVPDYRPVMAMLPALVGLLPCAGGAAFSAPLVQAVGSGHEVSPERKSFINYWYRHIWEYTFPLYPGLILAAAMLDVSVGTMVKFLFPGTIAALLVGIPIAFSGLPRATHSIKETPDERRKAFLALVEGISPVVVVVLLSLAAGLHLATSLVLVVGALLLIYRYHPKSALHLAREAFSPSILLLVLGLMILKDMMAASGAVEAVSDFLNRSGLNPLVLILALPFIAGLLTGYCPACVAISYPLILNLMGTGVSAVRIGAIAYSIGFTGVLLSPVHLCFLLTVQYFQANLARVYRMLLLPVPAPLCAIILWNVLVMGRL